MIHYAVRTVICFLVFTVVSPVSGHQAFKKHLEKEYKGMKVSCNACHVKGKPKTERSDFGKLFYSELKSDNISATFKKKKGAEKKKYEKEKMIPLFTKALEKVKKEKQNENDEDEDAKTYDDLIKGGEIDGIKEKPKKDTEK